MAVTPAGIVMDFKLTQFWKVPLGRYVIFGGIVKDVNGQDWNVLYAPILVILFIFS